MKLSRLCHSVVLLIYLPLVEQVTEGHKPNLVLRATEERNTVKY